MKQWKHTCTNAQIHTHKHIHTHAHPRIRKNAYEHTHTHTLATHTCTRTRARTHVHTPRTHVDLHCTTSLSARWRLAAFLSMMARLIPCWEPLLGESVVHGNFIIKQCMQWSPCAKHGFLFQHGAQKMFRLKLDWFYAFLREAVKYFAYGTMSLLSFPIIIIRCWSIGCALHVCVHGVWARCSCAFVLTKNCAHHHAMFNAWIN